MSVRDGQRVRASVLNAAFISKTTERKGVINLASGDSYKDIVFSSPLADNTYSIAIGFETSEANPIFPNYHYSNITTSGFRVVFNAQIDSSNYKLHYSVGAQL